VGNGELGRNGITQGNEETEKNASVSLLLCLKPVFSVPTVHYTVSKTAVGAAVADFFGLV
jgi:hypothetical protein